MCNPLFHNCSTECAIVCVIASANFSNCFIGELRVYSSVGVTNVELKAERVLFNVTLFIPTLKYKMNAYRFNNESPERVGISVSVFR